MHRGVIIVDLRLGVGAAGDDENLVDASRSGVGALLAACVLAVVLGVVKQLKTQLMGIQTFPSEIQRATL